MPNSLKCRLKNLVRKGWLSEKDLERIVIIPIDATNGDVMLALHPKAEVTENDNLIQMEHRISKGWNTMLFNLDWWNAKFER